MKFKLFKLLSVLFTSALMSLSLPSHGYNIAIGQLHATSVAYDHVTLRKNMPLARQIKKGHTLFEIKYDFDLHGETLKMPADCILKFEGGHFINGKILFDETIIESSYSEVFDQIAVEGTIANREVRLSWWRLAYDKKINDAILINQVIEAIDNCVFYFDILEDIYVGSDKTDGRSDETVAFLNKRNLVVIQPTEFYTILRGRSTTGGVVRCNENKYISIDGLKVDGGHVSFEKFGENGIGVVGNEKVLIQNCLIRNCYSNCFASNANGTLTKNGYPEWGSGGKGIQIEGGTVSTQAIIRNNSIRECYIGISNNASDQENIIMDGNYIDSCYMSLILMRLGGTSKRMNVNISNTIIANNTGDMGAICMGNAANVNMTNTQVKGEGKLTSVLRGCFSYCNIQMIVNQHCETLIDAALYRDNPEGKEAADNYVKIIADKSCDYIINTSSSVIPKQNGSRYTEFIGGNFDIIVQGDVNKTFLVMPSANNTTQFTVRTRKTLRSGVADSINSKNR